MKTILLLLTLLIIPSLAGAMDLTTIGGDVYRDAIVQEIHDSGLKITCADGIREIAAGKLTDEDLTRYFPGKDWSSDGRFWYDRYETLYRRWQASGATSAESLREAMKTILPHRELIAEYVKLLQQAEASEQARKRKEDEDREKAARAKVARARAQQELEEMRIYNDPYLRQQALKNALEERYLQNRTKQLQGKQ